MDGVEVHQLDQNAKHAGIDFTLLQGQTQVQSHVRIYPVKDVCEEAKNVMEFLKTIRNDYRNLRDNAKGFNEQQAAQYLWKCNNDLIAFCKTNERKYMPEAGQRTMKMEKERQEDQRLIQHLEVRAAKLEKELKDAIKAKENALNRLSEVQSRLLKQGNPEIADLSDENRPTNLGQRFKQLYEDEWTDAFEFLTEKMDADGRVDDKKAIEILYEMLKRCKELCVQGQAMQHSELAKLVLKPCFFKADQGTARGFASNQVTKKPVVGRPDSKPQSASKQGGNSDKLQIPVQSVNKQETESKKPDCSKAMPTKPSSSEGQSKVGNKGQMVNKNAQTRTKMTSKIPDVYDAGQIQEPSVSTTDVQKTIEKYNVLFKDFFKEIANDTLKCLPYTDLLMEINNDGHFEEEILHNSEIKTYLQKCFNICWLMLAQNPPMLMDFETKSGHTMDMNVFEPYSTRGQIIDQVIWPPVFLHKGGPVVGKGYAEGIIIKKK